MPALPTILQWETWILDKIGGSLYINTPWNHIIEALRGRDKPILNEAFYMLELVLNSAPSLLKSFTMP